MWLINYFYFKKWPKKNLEITKNFILLFFHFLKNKFAKFAKIRKKILIVIETGLGETVIGPNSMVFNLTIPCGIVPKVESSPKLSEKAATGRFALRRSWRGREGRRERQERGWPLRMRFS
jgi:hypothetical protein